MKQHEISNSYISDTLTHFTRNYEGENAKENMINILASHTIKARTHNCLFSPLIDKYLAEYKLGDDYPSIKSLFNTVCFTDISSKHFNDFISSPMSSTRFSSYAIRFKKDILLKLGVNPVIYINDTIPQYVSAYNNIMLDANKCKEIYLEERSAIKFYLLNLFKAEFTSNMEKYEDGEYLHRFYYNQFQYNKIAFYSLINLVNEQVDFMHQREWRHLWDFSFDYSYVYELIAVNPKKFRAELKQKLNSHIINSLSHVRITTINNNESIKMLEE